MKQDGWLYLSTACVALLAGSFAFLNVLNVLFGAIVLPLKLSSNARALKDSFVVERSVRLPLGLLYIRDDPSSLQTVDWRLKVTLPTLTEAFPFHQ